jgi:CysZ protein
MLTDLARAVAMLAVPVVQRTLLLAIGLAVTLLILALPATDALVRAAGSTGYVLLDRVLEAAGLASTLLLAWLVYPSVIAAVLGFLLERVVAATEARYFPALSPAREQRMVEVAVYSVGFAAVVLGLNVVVLPLYLVPGLNVPVYLLLNGYLLGREYTELVLARRHPIGELGALRRRHKSQLWGSGLVTALVLMVPVVNLAAPIVGAAFATLRLHRAGAELPIRTGFRGIRDT